MLWRIFCKVCTNVHSDSKMNSFDLKVIGQRSRTLQPHVHPLLELSISGVTWGKFFYIWYKRQFGLKDELIWFWRSKVRHCDLVYCEHNISRTPWGSFFKCGTNVNFDSRKNGLDFGGQRSKSLWPKILWAQYFKNAFRDYCQIWHKVTLGLEGEPIRLWRSKVRGQCDKNHSRPSSWPTTVLSLVLCLTETFYCRAVILVCS